MEKKESKRQRQARRTEKENPEISEMEWHGEKIVSECQREYEGRNEERTKGRTVTWEEGNQGAEPKGQG
jgi:hypothetical protein